MDQALERRVRDNLFPAAQDGIDFARFPWHGSEAGGSDADQPHSSQALAIDLFGTLRGSAERDAVCNRLAATLGLPTSDRWQVELEWLAPSEHLKEPHPTPVDAVAIGQRSLIFFACRFTEPDGGCCPETQPFKRRGRPTAVPCNGNYAQQVNPVNNLVGRCALTGKGIKYWEVIPRVFSIDAGTDHLPCPFAGPTYQWMRNLALCWSVARARNLKPAFLVVYADAPGLPMAARVHSAEWTGLLAQVRSDAIRFRAYSYQELLRLAVAAAQRERPLYQSLQSWVEGKIARVAGAQKAR